MLINLTEYFDVQGKQTHIRIPYEAEKYFDGFTDLPIVNKSDLDLFIKKAEDDKLSVSGKMDITLRSACARCLKDVDVSVKLDFEYFIIEPDGFHEIDEAEQPFMNGYELDADALIDNELIMSLPMKVLCREDCKGLCPVCGKNLNDGECGCDTFVPDPRMAAISDIFNAYKEV